MLSRARVIGVAFILVIASSLVAAAAPPVPGPFHDTWARTDAVVKGGQVSRTWMWGPEANAGPLVEAYQESPGGQRTVQYFDKARMEITDPGADQSSPWYVTNGLLVVEMMTGQMQVGHDAFETRTPSNLNAAGDHDDPDGITYQTLADLRDESPREPNEVIATVVNHDGKLNNDWALSNLNVYAGPLAEATQHRTARVFWEFMTSEGLILEDGFLRRGPLFVDHYFATGLPITEAYWAYIDVAGTEKLVLIQAFERRVLTYTPSNPEGWQVEAGNVGQHYHRWRYGESVAETIVFVNRAEDGDRLYVKHGEQAPVLITTATPDVNLWDPQLSPDGTMIAFVKSWYLRPNPGGPGAIDKYAREIFLIDIHGGNERQVTDGGETATNAEPEWSPDGSQIAYIHDANPHTSVRHNTDIYLMDADGTNQHMLEAVDYNTQPIVSPKRSPTWSPDGRFIIFTYPCCEVLTESYLYVVETDATTGHTVAPFAVYVDSNDWSPDGESIVFRATSTDDPADSWIGTYDVSYEYLGGRVSLAMSLEPSSNPPLGDLDNIGAVTWSQSGEQIIFSASGPETQGTAIYIMNADGSERHVLADLPGDDIDPG